MNEDAFGFWKRVDEIKGKMSLSEIALKSGIKYQQIRHLRSENRYPKANEIFSIAEVLCTNTDFLIGGIKNKVDDLEMEFVRDNPLCRKIVRYLMEDESLLEVISAFIESSEKKQERKEG